MKSIFFMFLSFLKTATLHLRKLFTFNRQPAVSDVPSVRAQ